MSWIEVEFRFESLHPGYCKRLLKKAPKLSIAELRVAICCRMMLSIKEIHRVLGMSDRSIANHRWRIRQKARIPKRVETTK